MFQLEWKTWFEVGHEAIDFEHKTFFSLIHKTQCLVDEERGREEIVRTLEELYKYADFHFTSEENVMVEAEYEGIEHHKALHRDLLAKLREDVSRFEGGLDNAQEIVTFLFKWFLEHTVDEDLNISAAIKRKNLKAFFSSEECGKTSEA